MALRYLLDEDARGVLWRTLQRHNLTSPERLEVVRVGDSPDLPLGTPDPAVLLWAEREDRILISRDRKTLAGHLQAHLAAGRAVDARSLRSRRFLWKPPTAATR